MGTRSYNLSESHYLDKEGSPRFKKVHLSEGQSAFVFFLNFFVVVGGARQKQKDLLLMKEALSTVIREKMIPELIFFNIYLSTYLYSTEYLHKRCYRKSEQRGLHRCGGLTQVRHCLKTTLIKLSSQAASKSGCTRREENDSNILFL